MFSDESRRHQEEMTEKQRQEMQEMLEKKFAAEFKLSHPDAIDLTAMEGQWRHYVLSSK